MFEGKGVFSLESLDAEEDLKPRAGVRFSINAPPQDGRCYCCGMHISELTPFGKAGHPLVGNFNGALLVKQYRRDAPYIKEFEEIWEKFTRNCRTQEDYDKTRMIRELGEEKAGWVENCKIARGSIGASSECRDCILLDSEKHYKKVKQRYQRDKEMQRLGFEDQNMKDKRKKNSTIP